MDKMKRKQKACKPQLRYGKYMMCNATEAIE